MRILPGILLCLIIAIPSWLLGQTFPIMGGPVFAIIAGIIITTSFPTLISKGFGKDLPSGNGSTKKAFLLEPGIKYTSKKLLQYSIILLGFEMNLYNIIKVGGQSLMIMVFTLTASFLTAYFVGKALKLPSDMTTLIGVGTSICGGSAIAATAPVIQAKDEDVASAISTIFLFNILAVFIFPPLGHLMGMNDMHFGMWAGTAINDTSSVVAAGTAWSMAAGNNVALQFATIVKLTRTLMIVPITLVLALYMTKKSKAAGDSTFSFKKVFPWFILFFIAAAIANTFLGIPTEVSHFLVTLGKFLIVMAMSAIGLGTNIKVLIGNGIKPIALGMSCWIVISVLSLVVQHFITFA